MKKIMKLRIALVALLGVFSLNAVAQMGALPVDPKVRTGKLENGLTYYIRHNELPKERAEFYIAQKVGSMQEEEEQRGLAHFLEHMAFNGTTHFPGKSMLEYLESIGAKFGANINAYTSFDETVYTLMNIPVTRQGIIDSSLLVLYDWSCGIALEDEEIDNERGVIHEEWRTGQSAQMRIWDQVLPVVFEGSRYAHRLPIGLMEVVDNFPYQMIRDYYHKWYRPDLQGIIVVGDVDVDYVEAKIKEMFSDIPLDENRAERVYFPVPDNEETIVAFATDKEATNVRTTIYYKHDPIPAELKNSAAYYIQSYMNDVVGSMMNARLNEIMQKPNPPFLGAGAYDGQLLGATVTKEAFTTVVISDEKNIERAFRTIVEETRRIDQHGFTVSEYERAKANFLKQIETMYNEREKEQNRAYVQEYVRAFTEGEPIPGIETEYALYNQFVPMLPVDVINQYVKELITDNNIVIMMQGPDKEGVVYPSKEGILAIFDEVRSADTEAYVEEISDEPLVSKLPAPGSIVKTETDPTFDATVWTLSNGAKVVIKPTAFKADQILMQASSLGGYSLIGKEYDSEVNFLSTVASVGGLGNFNATDLRKVLAGKNAGVSASIGELNETVSANCSPKDLETMMQLVYLQFTAVRQDNEAFESWQSRMAASYRNMIADPMFAYQDSLYSTMYNHNSRMGIPSPEDIEKFNYENGLKLFRERFADAGDFTFIFVGNVDAETLKPYAEQYLATLPSTKKHEKPGQPIHLVKGKVDNFFEKTVESPKVTAAVVVSAPVEPTLKNNIELDMVAQILRSRYTETMREEEGGTYSPQVQMGLTTLKKEGLVLIMFDTNIEQYERLAEIAIREFEKLGQEGPGDVDFNKVKEYMLKKNGEDLQENNFWMRNINSKYLYGTDFMTGYTDAVNAMTKADIQAFVKAFLAAGNVIKVTMNGVAAQ